SLDAQGNARVASVTRKDGKARGTPIADGDLSSRLAQLEADLARERQRAASFEHALANAKALALEEAMPELAQNIAALERARAEAAHLKTELESRATELEALQREAAAAKKLLSETEGDREELQATLEEATAHADDAATRV